MNLLNHFTSTTLNLRDYSFELNSYIIKLLIIFSIGIPKNGVKEQNLNRYKTHSIWKQSEPISTRTIIETCSILVYFYRPYGCIWVAALMLVLMLLGALPMGPMPGWLGPMGPPGCPPGATIIPPGPPGCWFCGTRGFTPLPMATAATSACVSETCSRENCFRL